MASASPTPSPQAGEGNSWLDAWPPQAQKALVAMLLLFTVLLGYRASQQTSWACRPSELRKAERKQVAVSAPPEPQSERGELVALDSQPIRPQTSTRTSRKADALTNRVNPNRASLNELQLLPGIGPRLAQRIIDERTKSPFRSVDDLRRVSGIGPKTLDKLRPHLWVEGEPARLAAAPSAADAGEND